MKKLAGLLAVAGVVSLASMQANAQSAFEGFYGQLGVGYENMTPSTSSTLVVNGVNIPTSLTTNNTNSFAGTATLGYTFSITKDFLLGIGGEYSPFAGSSGNVNYNVVGYSIPIGSIKKKNSYNFFVSPGLAVGSNGLAYAKVGFTGAEFEGVGVTGGSSTSNYTGYSLGLGYKQFITGGLYGFGEVNYSKYGDKTDTSTGVIAGYRATANITSSATTTNFLVGLGYKF